MTEQINILYYPSSEELATNLIDRLKASGQKLLSKELDVETPFTVDTVEMGVYINAIILRKEDMENLSDVDWRTFPPMNVIGKDHSVVVVFCVNWSGMPPATLYDCFIVKEVRDSAESIRRELLQLHHLMYQKSKGRYGDFLGRNTEIEQFQNIYYSERAAKTSALVVSGRQGVGREAFVRECIRQEKGQIEYEPYTLSIGKSSSIELFLIQLNSICREYSESDILQLLGAEQEEKVEVAVKMLNGLFRNDDYLVLYDDGGSCIRYNRKLSEWFKSVVTHPMLDGGMHLFVISNVSVSYSRIMTEDDVAFITLYALTRSDRRKLLYRFLSNQGLVIAEEDAQILIDNLVYSPNQLLKVAEDIKEKGIKKVTSNIGEYHKAAAPCILELIKKYKTQEYYEAWNLLVLLSKIEYVGKNILHSLYPDTEDEIEKYIDLFMAEGIVERFGEWMDYIRLDSSISDYIRRNKLTYSKRDVHLQVTEALAGLLNGKQQITEDYSAYLFRIKRGVEQGRIDDDSYLVPSVWVNTIMEVYDRKDWDLTIKLCEDVLDQNPNYFQEVYREIRYWYCLALARKGHEVKFYQNVKYFNGADLHFLKGFFFRLKKEYAKAEKEYQTALDISPGVSRTKREMVVVLQAQHKFSASMEMAKAIYDKDPENPYNALAYYRCLVRKNDISHDERDLLDHLKKNQMHLFRMQSHKVNSYKDGMVFEYDRFINKLKPDMLILRAYELRRKYPDSEYIKDIVGDYFTSQGLEGTITPTDCCDDFNL